MRAGALPWPVPCSIGVPDTQVRIAAGFTPAAFADADTRVTWGCLRRAVWPMNFAPRSSWSAAASRL